MLHHLDLNVSDLQVSDQFYGRLLTQLNYQRGETGEGWSSWLLGDFYLTLVQVEEDYLSRGFHRKGIGVNHLAFPMFSRDAVDRLWQWSETQEISVLYGGPLEMGTDADPNYALFLEDPDRLKLEFVYRSNQP